MAKETDKIKLTDICVNAFAIYRVIETIGLPRRTYRRAILVTRSRAKAEIYLNKLRDTFPDRVYELRMLGSGFTLADYLEILADISIQSNLLLNEEVLKYVLQPKED